VPKGFHYQDSRSISGFNKTRYNRRTKWVGIGRNKKLSSIQVNILHTRIEEIKHLIESLIVHVRTNIMMSSKIPHMLWK
jgi:hypothetical protein